MLGLQTHLLHTYVCAVVFKWSAGSEYFWAGTICKLKYSYFAPFPTYVTRLSSFHAIYTLLCSVRHCSLFNMFYVSWMCWSEMVITHLSGVVAYDQFRDVTVNAINAKKKKIMFSPVLPNSKSPWAWRVCSSGKSNMENMEHWWNDTDRAKLLYSDKNLFHCYFVHRRAHVEWPRIEPESFHCFEDKKLNRITFKDLFVPCSEHTPSRLFS